jgi:prepilin-type N-terminal cleavage/methylation domain-containing protein
MSGANPQFQRGFSIIEVMMATTILLVGFIGLIQAVTIGSSFLDTARKLEVANQIVSTEIEKLRCGDWSTIANLPASATIKIDSSGVISSVATSDSTNEARSFFALANRTAATTDDNTDLCTAAKGFTCSLTRTYLRPSGATSTTATYIKLVYMVSWTSNTNRTQSHQLVAYFAKNGLHLSFQQS